ncbi:hypothetical protein L341_0851 [Escherichia coli CE418]|nr:hypothetical protein L341_0851 [Escherichia coli CE418]
MNTARVVNNLEGRNISALFLACHIVCYTSQFSLLLLHK